VTAIGATDRASRAIRRRWPFWSAGAVLVVGLVVTGVLTWVSTGLYTRNEKHLLDLRAREVGAVLTAALPSIQTPLASAAALADASGGNVRRFKQFVSPYVGVGPTKQFVSASLWRAGHPEHGPVAVLGTAPVLSSHMGQARALFGRAAATSLLTVIGFLRSPPFRLGYAFKGSVPGQFAVYAESALPSDRYARAQTNSAFSDLDYALYLGRNHDAADLLIASGRHVPLSGRVARTTVPFGDTFFTVGVRARRPLAGSFPQRLPWAIAIVGALLTLGAVLLTMRLIDRRRGAERLASRLEEVADENRRLYAEQRGIAQTLQHALLPATLPQLPGLQTSARYEAGVEGVDIGGDWYDLIALDSGRLLLVVGDVSGRGLRAATTMAALRYAIHAYAAQGDSPAEVLTKLSKLVNVGSEGQLATVLCALVDVEARRVTVTSAGHLPPLMITEDRGEFVYAKVGLPVGVDRRASYISTTVSAPPGATLLAFTDGLVERRGESIDAGLERLRRHARSNHLALDELLTRVLSDLRDEEASDDTAIAGVRWVS
jgi:serine phosphatase RsbU (regulator of sigma subunit)